jgi:hypothetical protein
LWTADGFNMRAPRPPLLPPLLRLLLLLLILAAASTSASSGAGRSRVFDEALGDLRSEAQRAESGSDNDELVARILASMVRALRLRQISTYDDGHGN